MTDFIMMWYTRGTFYSFVLYDLGLFVKNPLSLSPLTEES